MRSMVEGASIVSAASVAGLKRIKKGSFRE